MTEISLIVTLNNQLTSHHLCIDCYFNFRINSTVSVRWFFINAAIWLPPVVVHVLSDYALQQNRPSALHNQKHECRFIQFIAIHAIIYLGLSFMVHDQSYFKYLINYLILTFLLNHQQCFH